MSHSWLTALEQTDDVFITFLLSCIEAGPDYCPLANITGPATNADDLLNLTNNAFQYLLDSNLLLGKNRGSGYWDTFKPATVYEQLKVVLFSLLYSPVNWPYLADAMVQPLQLNFTGFTTDIDLPPNTTVWNEGIYSFFGIACSDAAYRAKSPEDMQWLVEAQSNVSSFDDTIALQMAPCYQWKFQPAERYDGDFVAKTKFPILYSGNVADPVTPIASAFNASSGFEGSVVLTHGVSLLTNHQKLITNILLGAWSLFLRTTISLYSSCDPYILCQRYAT